MSMEPEYLQPEEPGASVTELVKRLGSRKASEREEAEQALIKRGADAVEALTVVLMEEERRRKKRRPLRHLINLLICGSGFYVLITLKLAEVPLALTASIFMLLAFFASDLLAGPSRLQKRAANVLTQLDDVCAVGPLVDAMEFTQGQRTVLAALTRLLPRLRASDAASLNDDRRAVLYRFMKWYADLLHHSPNDNEAAGFVIAVLKALEQVGDSKALPFVAEIAEAGTLSHNERRVREAAEACLPLLQERADRERISQTLLRPASPPDAPADVLLRPAQGVSEADPQLLLRPSAPDEPQ